ncbi:anti-sigma regulatory factor [Spirulina subsalsa FACHB-351]|uniref:Anti-sigma regulatory factor n=1 Tax=Spirulina subsalsa FACHB-351 TaxID=234711 RepID=A0ABT3LBX3_9CYAN|nr:anti-sigma regulatory factor [Spirulina subsalsa FACHB-351]
MIAISLPAKKQNWETMSFASTLYLCPILDLLLAKIPPEWQAEIRLGLQEALVNAAKHGNKLDPSKTVSVQFSVTENLYSWVISDQGSGFSPTCTCPNHEHWPEPEDLLPPEDFDHGRGLCILYQIFDHVHWNRGGTQLRLSKEVKPHDTALVS